jgi:hypothetical protein
MTVALFASSAMRNGLLRIAIVTFSTVVAMASSCVMTAVDANSSTLAAREAIELHVETTTSGVKIAVARCAFVGILGRGPSPRPIMVKRFTLLAVPPGRVVLAVAD